MNSNDFTDNSYKFRTAHRDDYYEKLEENLQTKLFFSSKMFTFLIGFAIGFHLDQRKKVNEDGKPINHTNLVNFPNDAVDIIKTLMLERFPNIQTDNELWSIVEEYAEYGVCIAYDSILVKNNGEIDIDDILGRKLN